MKPLPPLPAQVGGDPDEGSGYLLHELRLLSDSSECVARRAHYTGGERAVS